MKALERLHATAHLAKLKMYKIRLEQMQPTDGTWDWFLENEMEEIRADIKKAAL